MRGFQAAGAAPLVTGEPVPDPETLATAIRIGNPASWQLAVAARDESGGRFEAVTDEQILAAQRELAAPRRRLRRARLRRGRRRPAQDARGGASRTPGRPVVVTVTGHGLKDTDTALEGFRPTRRHRRRRRRRRRGRGRRTGAERGDVTLRRRPGRGHRAGHQGQPRARLRRARPRAGAARQLDGRGDRDGLVVEVAGEGADDVAARRDATWWSGRCGRRSTRWGVAPPGAPAALRQRRSRTPAAWARPRPLSSPGSRWPAGWSPAALLLDDDGSFAARRRARGPPRQRRPGLLRRLRDRGREADELVRRPGRVDPRVAAVVFVPPTPCRPRSRAGCCRRRCRTPTPPPTPVGPRCWWPRSPGARAPARRHPRPAPPGLPASRRCPRRSGSSSAAGRRGAGGRLRGRARPCWPSSRTA